MAEAELDCLSPRARLAAIGLSWVAAAFWPLVRGAPMISGRSRASFELAALRLLMLLLALLSLLSLVLWDSVMFRRWLIPCRPRIPSVEVALRSLVACAPLRAGQVFGESEPVRMVMGRAAIGGSKDLFT